MDKSEEEISQLASKPVLEDVDMAFNMFSRDCNLNEDKLFVKALREIDGCDIPMPNVARDLLTGQTHSFDRVSTGLRSIWMMYHYPEKYIYLASRFGENCCDLLFQISQGRNIIVYDDVEFLSYDLLDDKEIEFTDFLTKKVCKGTGFECSDYYCKEVYKR